MDRERSGRRRRHGAHDDTRRGATRSENSLSRDVETGSKKGTHRRRNANKPRGNTERTRKQQGVLNLLPQDIVAQWVLPFLMWRETSALACVCVPWSVAVRAAKQHHVQWASTTYYGDTASDCMCEMANALGQNGGHHAVRFAPTFALVTLAYTDTRKARLDDRVWSNLVDLVVKENVLPVGCVLVGLLCDKNSSNYPPPLEEEQQQPWQVSLTFSVGHFPQTTVETAAFDRKELRWSASGLTEELECPFDRRDDESSKEKTSVLIWGKNTKSAQAVTALATQWFPHAPLSGSVVDALAGHASPLMAFTRPPRRVKKLQSRRKYKATTPSEDGVVSYPSALVVRLCGDVYVKPFAFCMDRPLTPVLKNESIASEHGYQDLWGLSRGVLYDMVSAVDNEAGGADTTGRLIAFLQHFIAQRDVLGPDSLSILRLYSSPSVDALRSSLSLSLRERDDVDGYQETTVPIRCVSLTVEERGAVSFEDHWEVGEFGVVSVPWSDQEFQKEIQREAQRLVASVALQGDCVFGGLVHRATVRDTHPGRSALPALQQAFADVKFHESIVAEAIGPLALFNGVRQFSPQCLLESTKGLLFCHSTSLGLLFSCLCDVMAMVKLGAHHRG